MYELRASGAEVMIKTAAPFWKERGIDLHVLSTSQNKGDYASNLANEGIIVHHLPFSKTFRFLFLLHNFFRSSNFDVVHIHTERYALTYALIARFARVPKIIRTIHGTYLFEGLTRFNRMVRRWIIRQLGVIQVSISDSVKQNEQIRFNNPTRLINNWYDDLYFYPPSPMERNKIRKNFGLSTGKKIIVSIGNCDPVKNHESIIKALLLMKSMGPNLEYWHIGEEDMEAREEKLVNELDLCPMVKFWSRQDDVRPFLWAADVFIMPSFREGLSIAMLESFGCGIPVVLARTPGLEQWSSIIPEIIYTGTSPADLAQGITLALQNGEKREEVDRSVITANFGVQRGVEEYFSLYQKNFKK